MDVAEQLRWGNYSVTFSTPLIGYLHSLVWDALRQTRLSQNWLSFKISFWYTNSIYVLYDLMLFSIAIMCVVGE